MALYMYNMAIYKALKDSLMVRDIMYNYDTAFRITSVFLLHLYSSAAGL